MFPVSIGPQLKEYPETSKGLEETLLDGVAKKLDIVDFFSFLLDDHLSGSNIFISIL